ncbi:uncharacterized protein G2W53_015636 [Senna tora]|uniref:Uncharacterized protein n=1 Tax=Senna tora TaxID=362788 RepID=A0A834WVC9_9FABA|nr:uncharacterized protein G2W53_015636 [Senna tora]
MPVGPVGGEKVGSQSAGGRGGSSVSLNGRAAARDALGSVQWSHLSQEDEGIWGQNPPKENQTWDDFSIPSTEEGLAKPSNEGYVLDWEWVDFVPNMGMNYPFPFSAP